MKRFLSMLIALAMLTGAFSAFADGEAQYKWVEMYQELQVKASSALSGIVEAPAEYEGKPVRAIGDNSYNRQREVTQLIIPDTVWAFGKQVGSYMENLQTLKLSNQLVAMDAGCFQNATALKEIVIPASVSYIDSVFNDCTSLEKVTFEGVCPVVDTLDPSFRNLAKSAVIYVPDDQLEAYMEAFQFDEIVQKKIRPSGKNAIVIDHTAKDEDFDFDPATGTILAYKGEAGRVDIPSSIGGVPVKVIGDNAFFEKYTVCYVTIPESVETIGKYAFGKTEALVYAVFPSTIKTIDNYAFINADLQALELKEGVETIGKSAFLTAFSTNIIPELVLPDSVRAIGDKAFSGNYFKKIVIGQGIETIGKEAFNKSGRAAEIEIHSVNDVAIGDKAFEGFGKLEKVTLTDGLSKGMYENYITVFTSIYPDIKINEPELKTSFPELDIEEGAPFVGVWNGVCATDGAEFYGMDLLDMTISVILHEDATGLLMMEGETDAGMWYMQDGSAMFGPSADECVTLMMDENGRMSVDLGGITLILEKEGVMYETPAIPEKPWPALDPNAAGNFIGHWEAACYISEGMEISPEIAGTMEIYLNEDGTAQMIEEGEDSGYELKWYVEYGCAYFGPTMSSVYEISLDLDGNLRIDMEEVTVVLTPYAEYVSPTIGGEHLIGQWLDDIGTKLILTEAGEMNIVYDDGYIREMKWAVVDGEAVVIEGIWEGCPITLEEGIVTITNGEGIYQIFSVDGDLSAAYGGDDDPYPIETMPIGEEGNAYFGTWILESMMGMSAADMGFTMTLTLNEDGTAVMFDGEAEETAFWTMTDGKAFVIGDEIIIDEDGKLVMGADGANMVFVKDGEGETAPEVKPADDRYAALVGVWNLVSMMGKDASTLGVEMKLSLYEDGSALFFDGDNEEETVWMLLDDQITVMGMSAALDENGRLTMSLYGIELIFEREGAKNETSPENDDGAAFLGTWKLKYMDGTDISSYGIEMSLTLNKDGTAVMFDGYSEEKGSWETAGGKAVVMDIEIFIDEYDRLVLSDDSTSMIFVREGGITSEQTEKAHSWDNGEITYQAACEENGVMTYTCITCGEVITEEIAAKGHTETTIPAEAATCTKAGLTEGAICSVCGKILKAQTVVAQNEHSWDNGKITSQATCEAKGTKTFTCTLCKTTKTEEVNAQGHTRVTIPAVEATCTKTGLTAGEKCSICGKILKAPAVVAQKGHTEVTIPAVAPTYSQTGLTEGTKCAVCGVVLVKQEAIAKLTPTPAPTPKPTPTPKPAYDGVWHLVYDVPGVLHVFLRAQGTEGVLELKADGTSELSGVAAETGRWYDDSGVVRFGMMDVPLTLLSGGFLRFGSEVSGYMIFSKDPNAVWDPHAPVIEIKPGYTYTDTTFVLREAEAMYDGKMYPVDVSAYGEYVVRFNSDGTVWFVQSGLELPQECLLWTEDAQGRYVIDYMVDSVLVMEYVFVPADENLKMDAYGVIMTFVPEE